MGHSEQGGRERGKSLGLRGFLAIALRYYRPYLAAVLVVGTALLVQTAFRIAVPLGYREIFDSAIAEENMARLFEIFVWLALGWGINTVASLVQDYLASSVGARTMNDIRIAMFDHLQNLSAGFFGRVSSGDLMSRFSNDLMVIESAFLRSIYTFLFSSLILVFSVGALFFMEWRLALMTFASLPVALVGPRILGSKAQKRNYDRKEYEALVAGTLQEAISSHVIVRSFGLAEMRSRQFREQLGRLADKATGAVFSSALVGRTSSLSVFLIQILIMTLGGYLAIRGFLSAGSLVGFVALLLNVSNAANHLSGTVPDLLQAAAGMQRIQEFLNEGPVVRDDPDATDLERMKRELYFQNVSFSYPGEGPALWKVSFRVKSGESVALVGPSGCGKSTILKMLMRFYDPTGGSIYLDHVDVRHCKKASLLNQIAMVPQESKLFNTTFRENIRMGKLDATDAEIEEAAKRAEIHDLIANLSQGYDTMVGEGGASLSGGQRQRIALARAFVRDPAILVLDEATSALDPGTESAINATLQQFARGRTLISATHRLGSVVDMNRILVIDKGRVAEEGTHEALMAAKGVYYELWRKQSGFNVSEDGISVEITPERLRGIPLFADLSEQSLAQVSRDLVSEMVPEKRAIFMRNDHGDRFFIIARGTVEVILSEDENARQVRWLQDGDYFGEMSVLEGTPRTATVRTVTRTLLLSLGRQHFDSLMKNEPQLKASIEAEVALRRGGDYVQEEDEAWGGGFQFSI